MRQLWQVSLVCLAALPLCGCSSSGGSGPEVGISAGDTSVYARYYRDCLRRGPFHNKKTRESACGCVLKYAKANFNEIEMEMFLARASGNKAKQQEIMSNSEYKDGIFKKKASGIITETMACSMKKRAG
jgi:hypothetical protein